jgi:ABC-2 type transport system ATP-binding protein
MSELAIEVQQLVHRYPGADAPAVNGLDLAVAQGEIVGLLGPNGAGKTTTLHAILGLLQPAGGSVRVLGHSPLADRLRVLPRINFASVDVDLPSNLTAREALNTFAGLYGVPRAGERMAGLVERFELSGLLRQAIGSLSSGEHMRLKLCKALINSPDLLILDEPTLSLDPYMAQKVRDLLKSIQRERRMAILHTSHNMHEVEAFCDRIVFLHHGTKLADGTPRQVLERFKSRSLNELFIRVASTGELIDAG